MFEDLLRGLQPALAYAPIPIMRYWSMLAGPVSTSLASEIGQVDHFQVRGPIDLTTIFYVNVVP